MMKSVAFVAIWGVCLGLQPQVSTAYQRPIFQQGPRPNFAGCPKPPKDTPVNTLVSLIVDETGAATAVRIAHSSGFECIDDRAVNAVSEYLFSPGSKNGHVTKVPLQVNIKFELVESEKGVQ